MEKIIFLDIDWVLNTYNSEDITNYLEEKFVNNLKYILSETGANIVISSDWKYDTIWLIKEWKKHWLQPYMDVTEKWLFNSKYKKHTLEEMRVAEISNWLKYYNWKHFSYNKQWIKYVVLDDMPLQIDNFVKTNMMKWLWKKETMEVIRILNN